MYKFKCRNVSEVIREMFVSAPALKWLTENLYINVPFAMQLSPRARLVLFGLVNLAVIKEKSPTAVIGV